MADEFQSVSDTPESQARNAHAVSPHATNPLPATSKALYVGGQGDVTVRLIDDIADVTFVNVPAGMILPIRASHVRAITSATNILNLY